MPTTIGMVYRLQRSGEHSYSRRHRGCHLGHSIYAPYLAHAALLLARTVIDCSDQPPPTSPSYRQAPPACLRHSCYCAATPLPGHAALLADNNVLRCSAALPRLSAATTGLDYINAAGFASGYYVMNILYHVRYTRRIWLLRFISFTYLKDLFGVLAAWVSPVLIFPNRCGLPDVLCVPVALYMCAIPRIRPLSLSPTGFDAHRRTPSVAHLPAARKLRSLLHTPHLPPRTLHTLRFDIRLYKTV